MGVKSQYRIKLNPSPKDAIFGGDSETVDPSLYDVNFNIEDVLELERGINLLDAITLPTENIDNVIDRGLYQFATTGDNAITAPKYDADNKLIRDAILGFNMYANSLLLTIEVFTDLEVTPQTYYKQTLTSFYDGETYVRTKRGATAWGVFKRVTTTL